MKFIDQNGDVITKNVVKAFIFAFLVLIILFNLPFVFVPVGYRGVQIRLGNTTGNIYQQGINFQVPFIEKSKNIEVRTQKVEVEASSASKDLQTVSTKVALNYSLNEKQLVDLYQTIGEEYDKRIIQPALQEAVKAVTAKFTAEELITKRNEVSNGIKTVLVERLTPRGIQVEDFSITNFDFSESFNNAVEKKVTAEQDALASKNKLEQVKYEAEQSVATAKGQAEAIRIQAEAINSQGGADYVQLQAIKQWNGVLPTQMTPNATLPILKLN